MAASLVGGQVLRRVVCRMGTRSSEKALDASCGVELLLVGDPPRPRIVDPLACGIYGHGYM